MEEAPKNEYLDPTIEAFKSMIIVNIDKLKTLIQEMDLDSEELHTYSDKIEIMLKELKG